MSGAAPWLAAGAAASSQHDADLAIGAAAPASAASAAEPSDHLLLRRADLTGLRQHRPDLLRQLHVQARDFLNAKIQAFSPHQEGRVQSQPVDPNDWPTWREYVASHAAAGIIVGAQGIKAIHIEQIDGVTDPNRGGQRRVDIVVYNADGRFFRLHPGSKKKVMRNSNREPGVTLVLLSPMQTALVLLSPE